MDIHPIHDDVAHAQTLVRIEQWRASSTKRAARQLEMSLLRWRSRASEREAQACARRQPSLWTLQRRAKRALASEPVAEGSTAPASGPCSAKTRAYSASGLPLASAALSAR